LTFPDFWFNIVNIVKKSAFAVICLEEIEVANMYGEKPAKCLGIKDRGKIEIGRRSDFCLMDKDYNVLKTIIKGKVVYQCE